MAESKVKRKRPKAATPEEQQSRCEAMALDIAEKRLADGTASSQIITHFIKQASLREQKEIEKLELEKELLKSKREAIEDQKEIKKMYAEAIEAMRVYSGSL